MTEPGARMGKSSMGESDRQGGKFCLQKIQQKLQ